MKVYTRTGDGGSTSLVGGTRVSKNDPRLEAYGTTDELTAFTAYLHDTMASYAELSSEQKELETILDHLMRLASDLATEEGSSKQLPAFGDDKAGYLEERIDRMQSDLPAITRFTLPGGHPLVSLCHVCRTVCRRNERTIVALSEQHNVSEDVKRYINRLSDYFYLLGRTVGQKLHAKEILWNY